MGTDSSNGRSADFQSVYPESFRGWSQNCILRTAYSFLGAGTSSRPADSKSAIQQIENLRYAASASFWRSGCLWSLVFVLCTSQVRAQPTDQKPFLPLHSTIVLLSGV